MVLGAGAGLPPVDGAVLPVPVLGVGAAPLGAAPLGAGAAPPPNATEKALPPVSADGVASVTPLADTMVSESTLALPIGALLALALVKFTVPKFDSGRTPFWLLGGSAVILA